MNHCRKTDRPEASPRFVGGTCRRLTGAAIVLLWVLSIWWMNGGAKVLGIERFPPPEFTTSYEMPKVETPPPASPFYEIVDVIVLAAALGVSALLSHRWRNRTGLFALAIFGLVWFGFVRRGCVCSIGAIQNVAQALGSQAGLTSGYVISFGAVAFFVLPLVFALLFGRTFCAGVCPLGAIQELTAIRPQRVPAWIDHALGLFPWIYLGVAVLYAATGTAYVICEYDPFVAFFRRTGSVEMVIFGAALLVIGVFVGRPYCRFLCPYGALLGLCSKVANKRVRIPPEDCIRCRLCEDSCPYEAILTPAEPLSPSQRPHAKRRALAALLLFPVFLAAGGAVGYVVHPALQQLDFETRLAGWTAVRGEEPADDEAAPQSEEDKFVHDALDAFAKTRQPRAALFARVAAKKRMFAFGGTLLGVWVGLVFALKWMQLSLHRVRREFEPDPQRCVACGRCFWYCPEEQVRRGWIERDQLVHIVDDVRQS
ncbi:hypothetical protein JCM19992_31020 [Thermostilla marina]